MCRLEDNVAEYSEPATGADEECEQHVASLRFHAILAEQAQNPPLGFINALFARRIAAHHSIALENA